MKKIKLALATLVITVAFANTPVKTNSFPLTTPSDRAQYVWYKDAEMTEETGTVCDVHIEINRLSQLFPGYTFSSHHMMGLYPYEFGDHTLLPTAIIYSDR